MLGYKSKVRAESSVIFEKATLQVPAQIIQDDIN